MLGGQVCFVVLNGDGGELQVEKGGVVGEFISYCLSSCGVSNFDSYVFLVIMVW
jgi:hypothetical protein